MIKIYWIGGKSRSARMSYIRVRKRVERMRATLLSRVSRNSTKDSLEWGDTHVCVSFGVA